MNLPKAFLSIVLTVSNLPCSYKLEITQVHSKNEILMENLKKQDQSSANHGSPGEFLSNIKSRELSFLMLVLLQVKKVVAQSKMDMASSLIFTLPKIRTSKKYQMARLVQRPQK